jgi:hypothetical protein
MNWKWTFSPRHSFPISGGKIHRMRKAVTFTVLPTFPSRNQMACKIARPEHDIFIHRSPMHPKDDSRYVWQALSVTLRVILFSGCHPNAATASGPGHRAFGFGIIIAAAREKGTGTGRSKMLHGHVASLFVPAAVSNPLQKLF